MPLNAVQNAKETYISDVAYILSISTFSLVIFGALREKLFCHSGVSNNKYFSYKLQYFFGHLPLTLLIIFTEVISEKFKKDTISAGPFR